MKRTITRWLLPIGFTATLVSCNALNEEHTSSREAGNETVSTLESPALKSPAQESPAPEKPSAKSIANSSSKPAKKPSTVRSTDPLSSWMAYPTGDEATSALLVERFVPTEVALGKEFETETTITNLTSMALDNVTLNEATHGNFILVSADPKATVSDEGHHWNLGTLRPKESRTVTVRGTSNGAKAVDTCMSVTYATSLCTYIPVVEPRLSLVASGPAEVLQCDGMVYEYVVTNAGTGSARNVVVEATLPEGLTAEGRSKFTKEVGTLEAGMSEKFTVEAIPGRTGKFEHTAYAKSLSGLTADSGPVATIVRKPILEIAYVVPEKTFAGRDLSYTITIKNVGDGIARDTVLEEVIAKGTKFKSASDKGVFAKDRVRWEFGNLNAGQSRQVTVRVATSELGNFQNRARAKAYCANDASAMAKTEVRGIPAILLEVVDLEDPIVVGEDETYLITVTNQGTAPATGVKIAVTLPDSVRFLSSTGSTRGPSAASAQRSFSFAPVASIAPGKEVSWRIVVKAEKAADARFKVSMTSDQLTSPVEETEATNFYE